MAQPLHQCTPCFCFRKNLSSRSRASSRFAPSHHRQCSVLLPRRSCAQLLLASAASRRPPRYGVARGRGRCFSAAGRRPDGWLAICRSGHTCGVAHTACGQRLVQVAPHNAHIGAWPFPLGAPRATGACSNRSTRAGVCWQQPHTVGRHSRARHPLPIQPCALRQVHRPRFVLCDAQKTR